MANHSAVSRSLMFTRQVWQSCAPYLGPVAARQPPAPGAVAAAVGSVGQS